MTRVVLDVADPDNLTDQEEAILVDKACEKILHDARNKINGDNINEIVKDNECPYGSYTDEK